MNTKRMLAAEQKVRDVEREMRDINRRILNAQVAISIFPLLLGAVFALYLVGESVLLAAAIGFGSILIAGIGIWLVEHSDLAEERQRVGNACEAAWGQLPHRKRNRLRIG